MNILPKKRWHVRTKENIARVRRDEAQAAAEEKERQKRVQIAESEARIEALRRKAKLRPQDEVIIEKPNSSSNSSARKHINFFEDLEEGKVVSDATNAEHEREKKDEREKYEKQIGYLTYLGQDTVEATGKILWYNKAPDRGSSSASCSDSIDKNKMLADPIHHIRHYLNIKEPHSSSIRKRKRDDTSVKIDSLHKNRKAKKRRKHYKEKYKKCKHQRSSSTSRSSCSSSSETEPRTKESNSTLEKLRIERLKREQQEHKRTEALLAKIRGEPEPKEKPPPVIHYQRYNSQFNPELARQNKIIN